VQPGQTIFARDFDNRTIIDNRDALRFEQLALFDKRIIKV
jgi:hypothetical protein